MQDVICLTQIVHRLESPRLGVAQTSRYWFSACALRRYLETWDMSKATYSVEPVRNEPRSRLPQVRYTRIYTPFDSTSQRAIASPIRPAVPYAHIAFIYIPTSSVQIRLRVHVFPDGEVLNLGAARVWSLFLALQDQACRTIAYLGICSGSLAPLRHVRFGRGGRFVDMPL